MTGHISPPTTRGQKNANCRSAAEWNVRAWTVPAPSDRSRVRISPAARVVNVTARISSPPWCPAAIRWPMRWVMVRVFPVPAPASTHTGPAGARTAAR